MNDTAQYRRKLTEEDLNRMRVPCRYWYVQPDQVSDESGKDGGVSARAVTLTYLNRIIDMRRNGSGLLLWGVNGTGKTGMAVVIAKEFRRRGFPVLFAEAADLKRLVVSHEMFDEDQTLWDRALNVDVLVLDDVGKGVIDTTEFGIRLIDELIRHRNANKLVTIMTTNMNVAQLTADLKPSSMAALKEHMVAVHVCGIDRRDAVCAEMTSTLFG